MKQFTYIISLLAFALSVSAQNNVNIRQSQDSAVNQQITIERDFQPVIQDAGKINSTPKIYEMPARQKKTIQYTDYNSMLSTDYNVNQLTYADSRFSSSPASYKGFLRAELGYPMSILDFYYKMNEADKVVFDVHLDHIGQWDKWSKYGAGILAKTGFGFDVDVLFGNSAFNIGFDAKNTASVRYYKGTYWNFDAHLGLHSTPSAPLKYKIQTGYRGFTAKNQNPDSIPMVDITPSIIDHQIQTIAMLEWTGGNHSIGVEALIKDHFYSTKDTLLKPVNFHSMHFEPYYSLKSNRFDMHLGVNLDLSLNRGRTFAASPNVRFEARVVPEWLALYGGAVGYYDMHDLNIDIERNNYINLLSAVRDSVNSYTIADAFLGLKFRPHHDLLFKVYAHYAYTLDDRYYVADEASRQFTTLYGNSDEWKIGGAVHYHYRDIATLSIDGFYSLHNAKDSLFTPAFDRPKWQLQIDLRVKLDKNKKWTLISENYIIGKRNALVGSVTTPPSVPVAMPMPPYPMETKELKTMIDLNLGLEYAIDRNFAAHLRLNDFINWGKMKNEQWYGYTTQGANILVGISWTF